MVSSASLSYQFISKFMKKIFLGIIFLNVLFVSCTKESGSISGSWTTPMEDQPQHQHGFTLKDEGTATSINLDNKAYEKWEKFGDRLILSGKSKQSTNAEKFNDTLKIISVNDSVMIVKANGKEVTYKKTSAPDKLVSDFENYDCYTYTTKKDTAFLHINTANGIITGDLSYQFFEKDRNNGIVSGKIIGDTLFADYTFSSEGQKSVREIIMIKKGSDLIEGFGEVEESNGKMKFTNRSKLNFKKGLTFKKINCP